MKGSKIKKLTIVLVIILIALVGFVGVYTQVQNRMENQVKDYSFAMDINGARFIELEPSTQTEESASNTEEGNGNTEENADNNADNNAESTKKNSEEVLTKENYKLSKEIVEEKLKNMGVQEYIVRLDEETGKISVEIDENTVADEVITNLITVSKFEIKDAETGEVLMNNDDLKTARVMYNSGSQTATSGTTVYLSIEFNKEGAKKLEEISGKYTPTAGENSSEENTNTSETSNTSEGEEVTNETATTENSTTENSTTEGSTTEGEASEDTEKSTEKKVSLEVDGQELINTSFDEVIKTGAIQLAYGQPSTDNNQINENANKANKVAMILRNRVMPIEYDVSENEYILSDITQDVLLKIEIAIAVIALIALFILIIRYKMDGLLAAISYIGLAGALLLIIRYTNTILSLEGITAIVLTLILNYICIQKLLKTKSLKETYKDFFIKIIPIIIVSIVFCFINWLPINSFGMVMFWGIVIIAVYNYVITESLLNLEVGGTNNEK